MSEEKERNPAFKLKDIGMFKSANIKLDCSSPIASGTGKYGEWNLWVGFVTNQKVYNRDANNKETLVEGYTGKVIFFPTEPVNKKLIELANGNNEVEVKITKSAKETAKGSLYTNYEVEKLSDGVASSAASSLTTGEALLLEDVDSLRKDGIAVTEADIITIAEEEKYGGDISKERAVELYKIFSKE